MVDAKQLIAIKEVHKFNDFSSVIEWSNLFQMKNLSIVLPKQLAFQLGLVPYHILIKNENENFEFFFNNETSQTVCNLINGLNQFKILSTGLLCDPDIELGKIQISDFELRETLLGNKQCITKNINASFVVENFCANTIKFKLITDFKTPLISQYCKVNVKAKRIKEK